MENENDKIRLRRDVLEHFEQIAPQYDTYKKNSSYYYSQLKQLLRTLIPQHQEYSILEIGCGTGSLLLDLNPVKGLGIDISPKMIEIAQSRSSGNAAIDFQIGEAENFNIEGQWDCVIMADVLEHLYNPEQAILQLASNMRTGSTLILTWANYLWEPVLHLLEKLKMKMPEGAHNWETRDTIITYLNHAGFTVDSEGTRCLIPAGIPLADTINNNLIKVFGLKQLGLIRFIKAIR